MHTSNTADLLLSKEKMNVLEFRLSAPALITIVYHIRRHALPSGNWREILGGGREELGKRVVLEGWFDKRSDEHRDGGEGRCGNGKSKADF